MERHDMYSNELAWYFHHLHEANVRTEVRPSIYPCNINPSLPLFFYCLLRLPSLFSSSSFSFLTLSLICENGARAIKIHLKDSNSLFKQSLIFSNSKSSYFYFLILLFLVLNKNAFY